MFRDIFTVSYNFLIRRVSTIVTEEEILIFLSIAVSVAVNNEESPSEAASIEIEHLSGVVFKKLLENALSFHGHLRLSRGEKNI